jgi:hypothetical protein
VDLLDFKGIGSSLRSAGTPQEIVVKAVLSCGDISTSFCRSVAAHGIIMQGDAETSGKIPRYLGVANLWKGKECSRRFRRSQVITKVLNTGCVLGLPDFLCKVPRE